MRNMRSALRSSRPSTFTNSRSPSGVTAKYGVDPRASTLAGVICSTGSPTMARPEAIDSAPARRGRRADDRDRRGTGEPSEEHGLDRSERHLRRHRAHHHQVR